jgi:predicted DNA binding CopG/RHH family protein
LAPRVRISEELCQRIEKQADKEGITVSELIKKLVSMLTVDRGLSK